MARATAVVYGMIDESKIVRAPGRYCHVFGVTKCDPVSHRPAITPHRPQRGVYPLVFSLDLTDSTGRYKALVALQWGLDRERRCGLYRQS